MGIALAIGFAASLLLSSRERQSASSSLPTAITWGTLTGIAVIGVLALSWFGTSRDVDGTKVLLKLTLPLVAGWAVGCISGRIASQSMRRVKA